MPICKKCNTSFFSWQVIEGKPRNLQRRKYCLACSPFKQHNTAQLHLPNGKDDRIITCILCGKRYLYDRKKGHTLDKCGSCSVNARRFEVKKKAVEYKGGKCHLCGYDRCTSALEFHHVDRSMKEFSFSGNHSVSWKRMKAELDKCICVCCLCHREIHAGLIREETILAAGHESAL